MNQAGANSRSCLSAIFLLVFLLPSSRCCTMATMFGRMIRRISHGVIPRADRPWDDDGAFSVVILQPNLIRYTATSNAPKSASRKRRMLSPDDDNDDERVSKRARDVSVTNTDDSEAQWVKEGVKEVTLGVRDVEIQPKDVPLPVDDVDVEEKVEDVGEVKEDEEQVQPSQVPLPDDDEQIQPLDEGASVIEPPSTTDALTTSNDAPLATTTPPSLSSPLPDTPKERVEVEVPSTPPIVAADLPKDVPDHTVDA